MADRSMLKRNLRYHRLVVLAVVILAIWLQYEFTSGDWNYDNGQHKISGQKVNGLSEGKWVWYYENGRKQMEGTFIQGKRNGLWIIYNINGNKVSESMYSDDKLNGHFTHWHLNGRIKSEGNYRADKLNGSVKEYDTTGVGIQIIEYSDGKVR